MGVDSTQPGIDETRASEDVVRKLLAAFDAGDLEGVFAAYPEEGFTYVDMTDPDTVLRSHADLQNWMEEFGSVLDTSSGGIRLASLTAQGPRAIAELEVSGRYIGDGAPEGGIDVVLRSCVVYVIENSLIVAERVYSDALDRQIARAIGQ